jgi:predicted RNase H-like nuclease (RuvC/YqgF family)
MSDYFSEYIKELDPIHKELLQKIEGLRSKLEQINRELFSGSNSERESIAKQLYGLRSKVKKTIEEENTIKILEERLKAIPDREELLIQKENLEKEIKVLEDEFTNTPFIVKDCEITPIIIYKTETGAYIKQSLDSTGTPKGEFYYYPEIEGRTAEPNFKIEVDENGIPVKQSWIIQKSFFSHGLPLRFERKLVLKQPIVEQLKPKIVEKEVPQYVEKKVRVERFIPSLQCLCGWNLEQQLRMTFCKNCGKSVYEVFLKQIENAMKFENDREKKNKKKWKLFK